jgi:hypothetical protein
VKYTEIDLVREMHSLILRETWLEQAFRGSRFSCSFFRWPECELEVLVNGERREHCTGTLTFSFIVGPTVKVFIF